MKLIIRIILAIAVLCAVALLLIYLSLNRIVDKGVEAVGSRVTQTSVSLQDVSISPFSGNGELRGLQVGNPEGFNTDHAFTLGSIRIHMSPASVLSDTIVIQDIFIDAPEITLEQGLRGNNINAIRRNVRAFTGPPADKTQAEPQKKPGKKIIIDKLVLQNAKVHVSTPMLKGRKTTFSLPRIELTDIGKGSKTATIADVLNQVLNAVTEAVVNTAGDSVDFIKKGTFLLEGGEELEKSVR
ncbi:MAG: hypothetical protein K9N51_11630, partial [Candidatus Pacebacteria bacterium]|nr:hypothetical protein [Candidatus Paceibacterota bacterium]